MEARPAHGAAEAGGPAAPAARDTTSSEVKPDADRALRLLEPDGGARPWTRSPSTWASARRSRTPRCSRPPPSSSRRSRGSAPSVRRAKKSVANFKVREGMPVGVAVTLRRARMWEFLDRLISIAMPRIRDFRGLNPRSFDGRGNYSMGDPRADHLPRDRLRLDRRGARPRRDDHHHRQDRRGGVRPARRARDALLRRRVAPARRTPRRRPRRSAQGGGPRAGRGRGGRARAAQGGEPRGLREARAGPRRAKRARKAPRARAAAEARPRATTTKGEDSAERGRRKERTDGEDFAKGAAAPRPRSSRPAATTAAAAAAGRAPYYRKFGLCRICLREAAHNGLRARA